VLPSENANRIHKGLTEKTPWSLAFNDRDKHIDVSATQLATMPKQSVNQLQHAIYVDAQATRYMPGHFLSTHDDAIEGKNRRAAYIFNFTPEWRPDWGGYLQLLDDAGHVRRGLVPSFSTLNILAVPQRHNVSVVAPFAGGMRFAISGWFRYGEKPAMSR
jgi:Rps23 Pro-64 3,4-dihydroxylase Tpa1-like proline 4-hydroxylase